MFPFLKNRTTQLQLVIAIVAVVLTAFWPLTPALSGDTAMLVRLVSAVLAVAGCAAIALVSRGGRLPRVWMVIAAVTGGLALATLFQHFNALTICISDYNGTPKIIGRQYTGFGEKFVADNPGQPPAAVLFDAGGQVDAIWTRASIARCEFWVSWGGVLAVPLLAIAVSALVARRGSGLLGASAERLTPTRGAVPSESVYDAFVSYRRLDRERAEALVETLESRGFHLAIDFRDFRPNETVLAEMERCIIESRFVLCVITTHYGSSGFTNEEALMAKLLDLTERRNRIVPLIFEQVPLPAWLAGLVGINFTSAAQIDPIEKLVSLLSVRDGPR